MFYDFLCPLESFPLANENSESADEERAELEAKSEGKTNIKTIRQMYMDN